MKRTFKINYVSFARHFRPTLKFAILRSREPSYSCSFERKCFQIAISGMSHNLYRKPTPTILRDKIQKASASILHLRCDVYVSLVRWEFMPPSISFDKDETILKNIFFKCCTQCIGIDFIIYNPPARISQGILWFSSSIKKNFCFASATQ